MVQAKISEMFAPELNAGIRVFSGGKDLIDIADMAAEERDSILYCFDQNVKKIENISPKLAASLRPQRDAMVKFAQIAKGTFPETKTYSYPGQSGGLAVDFITPYLYKYSTASAGAAAGSYDTNGYNASTVAGANVWDIDLVCGTPAYLAGSASKPYRGSAISGKHSYVVLFQDGIIELGTTPKIEQMFFKSELMDKYTPISMQPLVNQSIEEGRTIYQYSTPGIMPMSHMTGAYVVVQPNYTGTSSIPLLGMVFYETDFNLGAMAVRGAALS
jgi:hypothetical protein